MCLVVVKSTYHLWDQKRKAKLIKVSLVIKKNSNIGQTDEKNLHGVEKGNEKKKIPTFRIWSNEIKLG